MDAADKSQRTRSLDILDEDIPSAPLDSVNELLAPGFLRLKIPVWEKDNSRKGQPSPGGSLRRSKRSQSGSVKGPQAQNSKAARRQKESLHDDVSPTNSVTGSPQMGSPIDVPAKRTPVSSDRASELFLSSTLTKVDSTPPAEAAPRGQRVNSAGRQSDDANLKNVVEDFVTLGPESPPARLEGIQTE
ncbi:hypothetical protein N0V93_000438 [Gnomoniopsis smithogilvyi]|uniref:Uncharacterized protein n=1 Tax=Gnomoniopsis smithogilvyi TaxID=1191159 RepID=A0A9W8Z064_9PEZI|nr:hypothetical protein N0V93_000438 [Gnomoniopsis smithogilvyi]